MRIALTLINFVFGKLPILKWLDGKKTYLGFVFWLLSFAAEGLLLAAKFFPEAGLTVFSGHILEFLKMAEETLYKLGIDVMMLGVGHKAAKEMEQVQKVQKMAS